MWSFWLVNAFSLVILSANLVGHFTDHHEESFTFDMSPGILDTLNIDVLEGSQSSNRVLGNLSLQGDNLLVGDVELDIVRSKGDQFKLVYTKMSSGKNYTEAKNLVDMIDYLPVVEGNRLVLNNDFNINKGVQWRNQQVRLTLEVPEGKTIHFENKLSIVDNYDFADDDFTLWENKNEYWSMGNDGIVCSSCDPAERSLSDLVKYSNFTDINIDAPITVTLEKADQHSIEVKGSSKNKKRLEFIQTGHTLNITSDSRHRNLKLDVTIKLPDLKRIDLEDTGDIRLNGFEQNKMEISYSGRNDLKAFMNIDSIFIRQEGRNELDLTGKGKYMSLIMDDHAKMNAKKYEVNIVDLRASDHCNAKLFVNDLLRQANDESHHEIDIERGNPRFEDL